MIRKTELIPFGNKNRPGTSIKPRKITVHNTSNVQPGANALAHSRFVRTKGYYDHKGKRNYVSWHFTVDDKYVIKQLPLNEKAIHAGASANSMSLGIEICMHQGINQLAANRNAAKLIAYLCRKFDLKKTDVLTHNFWTGKNCPQLLLNSWNEFIDLVVYYFKRLNDEELIQFKSEIIDYSEIENFEESAISESEVNIDDIDFQFEHCLSENYE